MTQSNLPVVDVGPFIQGKGESGRVVDEMRAALSDLGFMYVCGHGIAPDMFERAMESSRNFFAQPAAFKDRFAYDRNDLEANFGFHGLKTERLDTSGAPDLKESFSMRNAPSVPRGERWPSDEFRHVNLYLYEAFRAASFCILRILATGLDLPLEFFTQRHRGQNVTQRLLHYPAGTPATSIEQLGAGAHTDYGSITLLHQDEVGGLEVRGSDGRWRLAPAVPGALLVNTGDLMQRWTNDRFQSTAHRVRAVGGSTDRYSIAFFVDPDTDVRVECIESCRIDRAPSRYPTITAGEHIQSRIAASQALGYRETRT